MKVSTGAALAGGVICLATGIGLLARSMAASEAEAQARMEAESARLQREHAEAQTKRQAAVAAHANSLATALRTAGFADSADGPHDSAVAFSKWAARNMTLADVGDRLHAATTYIKVIASADSERGKRICFLASVNQVLSRMGETGPIHMGLAIDGNANFFTLIAVRDATEVRKNSIVNFCGIVVGKEGFVDTADQPRQSVRLIGMFVTPANVANWRGSDATIETIATIDGVGPKVLNL